MTVEPQIAVPEDIPLEQAVLGAMMMRKGMIDIVAGDMEARHFSDPLHGRIFDMMVYLQSEGDVTPQILASVMRNDPAKESLKGGVYTYLGNIAEAAPIVASKSEIILWTKELKDLALRRRLMAIGGDLAKIALENPDDLDADQMAEGYIDELLLANSETSAPPLTPYEIGQQTIRELEDALGGKPIPVILSGIGPLDLELGGFRGGDLVTILGKSGMGKSALMCLLARLMAQSGIAVIFFSLEMKRNQVVERIVTDIDFDTAPRVVASGSRKGIAYSRVRNHRLDGDEFDRFVLANQKLQGLPLEIVDDDGLTMAQITARARAFAAKHKGKKIAVIGDYLQIVEPADPRETRERQVARIARGAKSLAKRLDCVSIWGSQMNENDESRNAAERRPRSSDARESRGIMNESDQMLAPWRAAVAVENRKPMGLGNEHPDMVMWFQEMREARHKFDLLCLKNRHGRRFDLALWADMAANAIRDRDPADQSTPEQDEAAQGLLV